MKEYVAIHGSKIAVPEVPIKDSMQYLIRDTRQSWWESDYMRQN